MKKRDHNSVAPFISHTTGITLPKNASTHFTLLISVQIQTTLKWLLKWIKHTLKDFHVWFEQVHLKSILNFKALHIKVNFVIEDPKIYKRKSITTLWKTTCMTANNPVTGQNLTNFIEYLLAHTILFISAICHMLHICHFSHALPCHDCNIWNHSCVANCIRFCHISMHILYHQ